MTQRRMRKGSKVTHLDTGINGRIVGSACDGWACEFDDGSQDIFSELELVLR